MRHVLLAMSLAAAACVGMNVGSVEDCAALCEQAATCGFLPSGLGFDAAGDQAQARANCEWRCGNSPTRDPTVATIAGCFATSDDTAEHAWCDDESDERHAQWAKCAAISRCLEQELAQHQVHGDAALKVQLISFTDYEERFEADIAALYPAAAETGPQQVRSCEPSLCGPTRCMELECAPGGCEAPEDLGCDATLCSVGMLSVSGVCEDLGAREITALIRAVGGPPVLDVFVDAAAGLNTGCKASAHEVESDLFNFEPGPVQVDARVVGELPAGRLVELGLLADPGPDPEARLAYCLEFTGPPVLVRTGENTAVVPIGAVEDLLQLIADGGALRRCSPCPAATICGPEAP